VREDDPPRRVDARVVQAPSARLDGSCGAISFDVSGWRRMGTGVGCLGVVRAETPRHAQAYPAAATDLSSGSLKRP